MKQEPEKGRRVGPPPLPKEVVQAVMEKIDKLEKRKGKTRPPQERKDGEKR